MRVLLLVAVLAVVTPFASSYAQLPAPPDSELPTGTAVKFWSRQNGSHWISGRLMRFAPKQEEQPRCIGIMADRKSTRLNSSHPSISYAVFCLKKKINDEL